VHPQVRLFLPVKLERFLQQLGLVRFHSLILRLRGRRFQTKVSAERRAVFLPVRLAEC